MNYWLAQLILAARNGDDKDTGWMRILVFVILAVFYALGSIVKARANKTAPKGKEQMPRKPAGKPPESIDLQMLKQLFGIPEKPAPTSGQAHPQVTKPQAHPTSRKVARPQPAAGRKVPIEMSKIAAMEPQVQPKLEKITAGVAAPAEIPQEKYLSEILSDYDDPEKLRRAILHYEILGKPLSLRDPSEHLIGF